MSRNLAGVLPARTGNEPASSAKIETEAMTVAGAVCARGGRALCEALAAYAGAAALAHAAPYTLLLTRPRRDREEF
jgi:hypothetical protein